MITPDIKYIGVDDADLDLFESQYAVPDGISYNSYVIYDERVAVMDTVDRRRAGQWRDNLHRALGGRKPDYLVVHHLEPDHAAQIGAVMTEYPQLKLVATARAAAMLPQFFEDVDFEGRTITVAEGDKLELGKHTLRFIMAPMVHWPEVMVSYDERDKALFSADAFGKFGILAHNDGDWADEARRYYFNICGKYGVQVQSLLKKISVLDTEIICPLHGPVLRENLPYYVGLYDMWSSYAAETDGVLVAYASIHGGTAEAAGKLAEILRDRGAGDVVITDLSRCDMSAAVGDAFRLGRMVVAAASYDADIFPPMHDFLHHLQLKGYRNRRVAIVENGSWAPVAGRIMRGMLEQMKGVEIVEPAVTIRSRMKRSDIPALEALADALLA